MRVEKQSTKANIWSLGFFILGFSRAAGVNLGLLKNLSKAKCFSFSMLQKNNVYKRFKKTYNDISIAVGWGRTTAFVVVIKWFRASGSFGAGAISVISQLDGIGAYTVPNVIGIVCIFLSPKIKFNFCILGTYSKTEKYFLNSFLANSWHLVSKVLGLDFYCTLVVQVTMELGCWNKFFEQKIKTIPKTNQKTSFFLLCHFLTSANFKQSKKKFYKNKEI
ncbi:hypothetical protein RFI_26749 [Reticulomyxa filosa]|uniref:Uncharacterized protein n=1 Tax=Reticulomyxa filosa TaxID=46433 RepID=X6M9E7_RETFI|nr:hypothetical protein RFI_26749 [Reticulomyxa filosa]|eukprot:ETO10628.1 hypothetical protein RFI_26749 [Reticulomyxa filosa]